VVDGETGFLVPPRSVEATAAAIDRLLAEPELRERMGRAGRAVALERFATDRYAARVLRAYEETIRRSREILERGKVRRAGASA
jgi:glycosyltransferase involved in cell wall biosynthesis